MASVNETLQAVSGPRLVTFKEYGSESPGATEEGPVFSTLRFAVQLTGMEMDFSSCEGLQSVPRKAVARIAFTPAKHSGTSKTTGILTIPAATLPRAQTMFPDAKL